MTEFTIGAGTIPGHSRVVREGIPTEVIQQNLSQNDVKTTQDYLGVLYGSTRAPVSVYDLTPTGE